MADDAGALLVRSGLVSSNALDDARARVASIGGTLGEQLVTSGAITDDDLTDFYRARLLVPQVNPNTLARLTPKVVATIPSDMAIELRAIPVSLDGDNNLTVAMSDPSDRHAVDEIAFFTGAYVVRAVATQMQIAWCLAHYYGHVTALGQRLLHASGVGAPGAPQNGGRAPASTVSVKPRNKGGRTKGLTGRVNSTRHRAIAPITGPVDVRRPNSAELDLRPFDKAAAPVGDADPTPVDAVAMGLAAQAGAPAAATGVAAHADEPATTPRLAKPAGRKPNPPKLPSTVPSATPRSTPISQPSTAPLPGSTRMPAAGPGAATPAAGPAPSAATAASAPAAVPASPPAAPTSPASAPAASAASAPAESAAGSPPAAAPASAPAAPAAGSPPAATRSAASSAVPRAAPDAPTLPPGNAAPTTRPASASAAAGGGTPEKPRGRSISGEIRVPSRRAPSIRPPMPEAEPEAEPGGEPDAEPDSEDDEPLIMIERAPDEEDDTVIPRRPPPRRRIVKSDPPELYARAGEVQLKAGDDRAIDADEPRIVIDEDALAPPTARIDTRALRAQAAPPATVMDVTDHSTATVIHDRVVDRESQPILLDRPRATPQQLPPPGGGRVHERPDSDSDTGEIEIVVLDSKKPKPRLERRTQVGIPPAPVPVRSQRDLGAAGRAGPPLELDDPTMIDLHAAPPREDTTSDQIAVPPAPAHDADTNPFVIAPPPRPAPPPGGQTQPMPTLAVRPGMAPGMAPGMVVDDEETDEDGDPPRGPNTSEMSAVELDDAVPERTAEYTPEHLMRRRIDHDAVDDGWGPPGTTIPPPLLGAIPGSEDDEAPSVIPMPSVDSSPLLVSLPSPSAASDASGRALVRALEEATARAIDVIRRLEHAQTRDQVVDVMISHLSETHHRAGFFVTRHGKGPSELGVFAMSPRPAMMPTATLRLDRPSTLQDIVGTRLPYRGPMHDDASRAFLVSVLGACPAEILLVPVAVRERVVGVLFGEHRQRHTFDDQLALAARAAGMALERILKARRG